MRAKEHFLQSAERENWERLATSKTFQTACDAALLELVLEQPTTGTVDKGWDAHSQVVGARRFFEILSTIHLKEEPKPPLKLPKLPIPQ